MINIGKISKNGKDVILETQSNGCIKCISHCTDKDGYVRIRKDGKHDRLFRVLYENKYGKIPKGKVLRHLCNNAWCVNIEHLKIGTVKENCHDTMMCGRTMKNKENKKIRGIKNGSHKLNEAQVKEIYLSDLSYKKLAKIYNVSKTTISLIKNKKQWKWLTDALD